jgi:hypothetical protein
MSRARIPDWLRDRVADTARHRCGYCLMAEAIVGMPMEIDHLIPEALGGLSEEANLWLACPGCNARKSDRVLGIDPATGESVRLFDPRRQAWFEHFHWVESGARIEGLTAVGRATVATLQLNRAPLVAARRAWVTVGWHPPQI